MQQELKKWTVGTLNQCKLIGIKFRFALIHKKEQETKMPENGGILKIWGKKDIKIQACA